MNDQRTIGFSKMNGLGNDFIVIDARATPLALNAAQVRQLAARTHGTTKGCDQLLVIHAPRAAGDVFMQIFNADGSEVEACGNGARAVAAYLARSGMAKSHMETLGGSLHASADQKSATIAMPLPDFSAAGLPLTEALPSTDKVALHDDLPPAFLVNVGNPHAVMFTETAPGPLAADYGPALAQHPLFAAGANISFVQQKNATTLRLATFERGAGLTLACGTAACATAIAAIETGQCAGPELRLLPPVNQDDNDTQAIIIAYQPGVRLTMRGPVAFEFDAETEVSA